MADRNMADKETAEPNTASHDASPSAADLTTHSDAVDDGAKDPSASAPVGFIRQFELIDLVKAYDPDADEDGDGMPALLEFLFGTSDSIAGGSPIKIQLATDGDLLIEFPRDAGAEGLAIGFESSSDLATWRSEAGILEKVTLSPEPSEQWRLGSGSADRRFLRICVEN